VPRIDEREILRRLVLISQIKLSPESTAWAMERTRKVLFSMQGKVAGMPGKLKINEQELIRQLERLSQIDSGTGSSGRTMHQVHTVLVNRIPEKKETSKQTGIWGTILRTKISRFAAAAIFTIFILLPLSYGAVKIIKTYFFEEKPIYATQKGVDVTIMGPTKLSGEWDENQVKKVYDEVNRLKDAGKYEKTFVKEWVENGILYRAYRVRYILASGEVVTMGESQPVNDTNDIGADQSEDEE
jgi:hypothetical protein